MPTVMMMMILEMRSRDMFLQCPCTALTSQAKGRGASGDLQWPLSKNLLLGWGSSQPLLPLADDLSLLLYGPLLEREFLHRMSQVLHSFPSITVLILF